LAAEVVEEVLTVEAAEQGDMFFIQIKLY